MTSIDFFWRGQGVWKQFPAAVSLHGHTQASREDLCFVPAQIRRTPLAGTLLRAFENAYRRARGHSLDYSAFWWHPPLPASEAFRLETDQIRNVLNMRPMVSLTDHDQIAACRTVQMLLGADSTPVSLEWTVPLGASFLHLGVHHLRPSRAESIYRELLAYTAAPDARRLGELLEWLNESPGTLVVLNHPLWDEAHIGGAAHRKMVCDLLCRHEGRIHALELNGLRPWPENRAVLSLAREAGLPAVSGGDRHGTEASACLNLTHAASFPEFVDEIRNEHRSTILFMPRYADSHPMRQFEAVWDLARDYPEYPGRVHWTDRAFIRNRAGVVKSLSAIWADGEPIAARGCFGVLRLFAHEWMRPALRLAIARRQQEPAL